MMKHRNQGEAGRETVGVNKPPRTFKKGVAYTSPAQGDASLLWSRALRSPESPEKGIPIFASPSRLTLARYDGSGFKQGLVFLSSGPMPSGWMIAVGLLLFSSPVGEFVGCSTRYDAVPCFCPQSNLQKACKKPAVGSNLLGTTDVLLLMILVSQWMRARLLQHSGEHPAPWAQ